MEDEKGREEDGGEREITVEQDGVKVRKENSRIRKVIWYT